MTERKRTKGEERSYSEFLAQIEEGEAWLRQYKLKRAVIPPEWYRLAAKTPTKPKKTRLTTGYDADLVRWYRALGQGYQARMNAVLRAYMLAVVSKEIEVAGDRNWKGDPI